MRFLRWFSIFFIIGFIGWYFFSGANPYQTMSGQTMGTYYNIKVRASRENNMLHKKIKQKLEDINKSMSVFDPDSEISKINDAPAGQWIELSAGMAGLMKDAAKIWRISGGSFDPTVGKLVDLWGFGTHIPKSTPSAEEIKNVLKYTGFDKLKFADNYTRLQKKYTETYINLSAIAKGYGTDQVAKLLEEEGYKDYIVEIGGEVVARGNRSDEEKGWKVGVVEPNETGGTAYVVSLKNSAVATSGDYRNYYYKDGKKYSHTISPKTGYPVEYNLTSATVFNDSCMEADAVATAVMSMGESKALKFANDNNLSVIMFVKDRNDNMKTLVSNRAKKIIGE